MSECIFNVVTKDKQVEHVPKEMKPSPVQKHRCYEGDPDRSGCGGWTVYSGQDFYRNNTSRVDKILERPVAQCEFVEKDNDAGDQDKEINVRKETPGSEVFVSNRYHT